MDKYWNYVPQYYLKHNLIHPPEIIHVILLLFFIRTLLLPPDSLVCSPSSPLFQFMFNTSILFCVIINKNPFLPLLIPIVCIYLRWLVPDVYAEAGMAFITFDWYMFNSLEQRFYTHRLDGKFTPSHRYCLVERNCTGSLSYRILYIGIWRNIYISTVTRLISVLEFVLSFLWSRKIFDLFTLYLKKWLNLLITSYSCSHIVCIMRDLMMGR